jgi:hypothetical protein
MNSFISVKMQKFNEAMILLGAALQKFDQAKKELRIEEREKLLREGRENHRVEKLTDVLSGEGFKCAGALFHCEMDMESLEFGSDKNVLDAMDQVIYRIPEWLDMTIDFETDKEEFFSIDLSVGYDGNLKRGFVHSIRAPQEHSITKEEELYPSLRETIDRAFETICTHHERFLIRDRPAAQDLKFGY